jgi:acyl transferase domain-containing protein
MLAVGLSSEQAYKYLECFEDQIKIAATNSPESMTLSGEVEAMAELSAMLSKGGVFNRLLRTGGNVYHSHRMIPLCAEYVDILATGLARLKQLGMVDDTKRYGPILWASSVTPEKSQSIFEVTPTYWRANLESPVSFSQAASNLMKSETSPIDVFVEIGPHGALKSPLNQILKILGKSILYEPSFIKNEDG